MSFNLSINCPRSWMRSLAFTAGLVSGMTHAAPNSTAVWTTTWIASQQPVWAANALPLSDGLPETVGQTTVAQHVRVSVGGRRVRLVLSNQYGRETVHVGAASVARGTMHPVTFAGRRGVEIPAGETVTSDPVELLVEPLGTLGVRLYFPRPTTLGSFHWDGRQTAELAPGNQVDQQALLPVRTFQARVLLAAVDVETLQPASTIVAIGDSITEGNGATPDTNRRWPDRLAERLARDGVSVLNAGISGGQLLSDGMGEAGIVRFQRDTLALPHVRSVIVALGINDIGWPGSSFAPDRGLPTLDALAEGYRQLIAQAHAQGVRVIGATITPFAGALDGSPIHGYASRQKEALRQQVNQWIRESGAFDAVVDFDAAVRDPAQPDRLLPAFDSGDHLHPGDRGYASMAEAVDAAHLF